VCRIKGPDRDRLLALCQEQHTPGWFQQHGSRLPKQLMTLIDHENKAVAIGDFQSVIVPGLLQTGEYARAVISRVVKRATRRGGRSGGRPAGPAEPVQPGPPGPVQLLPARVRTAYPGGRARGDVGLVLQGQMYGRASLTCDDASPVFPATRHFSSI